MPPLAAAAYALWPAGVEQLRAAGADRYKASRFGGFAPGAAVLGARDRLHLDGNQPRVIRRCVETLQLLLPVGTCGRPGLIQQMPEELISLIVAEAQKLNYAELAHNLRRMRQI